jgi:class 3 adenylate cyclase
LAAAAAARGEVHLAGTDPEAAVAALREACRLWCQLDAPFEAARVRVLTAEALRLSGQGSNATEELETALSAFDRLGAIRESDRVRSMLQATRRTRSVRTLMFTDIVDSTRLVEALGDDAWGSLLEWHDRTLRGCFAVAKGREVNHEGDGFFVSFADPVDAVECAVAIQRTLAEHRLDHGFAPQVRIGVHATEAVDLGDDYLGKGVHEAARVGAAARAGEILVTAAVIDATGGNRTVSNHREVHLKGLALPLSVASVDWT